MSQPRSIALLGGPATGKTTYLGALVDALQSERIHHLRLDGLDADARALLRLSESLLEGRYPQRTKAGERHELVARLRTEASYFEPTTFTLRAGDYDGEEVERLFRDRIHGWSEEWSQRATASGLLLLVRPSALSRLPRLQPTAEVDEQERWRLLKQPGAPAEAQPGERLQAAPADPEAFHGALPLESVPPPPRATPSDPVTVPTAISIIELLQFIRHVRGLAPGERPRGEERLPIALIVSAWDTVDPAWHEAGPAAYLSHHLPLLEDYLWSNFHPEDLFRFGLSATGGNLEDAQYSTHYMDDPRGFVEWKDLHGVQHRRDIGLPLYWLLFGDRALSAPEGER
jgi:hypothetical protein